MNASGWGANRRILLVEDDTDLRETLVDLLTDEGYEVIPVENGARALDYLRNHAPPALVLLDLMMPVMDGWQFRVEQKRDPSIADTPVVAISADDSAKAAAVDADLYLRKPFDFKVLLHTVDRIVREGQMKRIAHTERMASLGMLAAGIAHEINNPLAYVIANLHYLDEHAPSSVVPQKVEEVQSVLREALDGAERIRRVVRQVKSFSAPEQERRVAVDVRHAIDAAANIAANEIRQRARLVKEYADVPAVLANESALAQVMLNLLVNAAQAIPEGNVLGNEIVVRTRTDGSGRAVVEVSDTGSGIRPELLGRIFEPFFTTKGVGAGTGLGLSICFGIVRSYGGDIHAESEMGKGTTFRVVLPPTEGPAVPRASPSSMPGPADAHRGRVLVIDDEPALARAIARLLARDHDVVSATSGREAIEILEGDPEFDLVLCDLMMPDVSGIEVYERLRETQPSLAERLVFVTGGAFTPRAEEFIASVPNPCIPKPVDAQQLRDLLRAATKH